MRALDIRLRAKVRLEGLRLTCLEAWVVALTGFGVYRVRVYTYFPNNPGKQKAKLSDRLLNEQNPESFKVRYWGTKYKV